MRECLYLLFKKILIASLTILALVYVAYLLLSANFDMYPTENAIKTTITENIYTNGYVIRDESILTNNTNGVLSYSCENGEEVLTLERLFSFAQMFSTSFL